MRHVRPLSSLAKFIQEASHEECVQHSESYDKKYIAGDCVTTPRVRTSDLWAGKENTIDGDIIFCFGHGTAVLPLYTLCFSHDGQQLQIQKRRYPELTQFKV